MTLEEFQRVYKLEVTITRQDPQNFLVVTKAIRRSDNFVKGKVETIMDIYETTDWLDASQAATSVTPWDWDKMINQIKRYHLDYFVQIVPIQQWYPLNTDTEIESLYL